MNPPDDLAADGDPQSISLPESDTPHGSLREGSSRRTRAAQRRRKVRRRALTGLAVVVVALVGLVVGVRHWYTTSLAGWGSDHRVVEVTIPQGSSTARIGELLVDREIIRNARVFTWRVRSNGAGPFEAGRYELPSHSSVDDTIDALTKGPLGPKTVRVSIPEGFRVPEIIERVHRDVPRLSVESLEEALRKRAITSPFLPDGATSYEGLLFPATYDIGEKTTAEQVLQQMADALRDRADRLDLVAGAQARGLSPYQVLVVASLIQAEAGNVDEAPKIARVIYNRLDAGEPLGIDATSRYLSILTGDNVDFESTSPFNTRRRAGLPPSPINAPGEFAINAALHPADGPWIWYVRDVTNDAQGRPRHVFTDSADEFERAKRACFEADLGCGSS